MEVGVKWAEGGNPTQAAAAGSFPKLMSFGMAWPMRDLGISPQMQTLKIITLRNPVLLENKNQYIDAMTGIIP